VCGITGFLTCSSETELEMRVSVSHMTDQLAHRGPDDSGIWVDREAGVALGQRRLSILDLSQDGHQPMHSESGRFVIVFNGEVYNFGALRTELEAKGHTFRGRSDTEVMLAAMEQWGVEAAVPRFNGMFAFAVWDRKTRQLHLVRDRTGEKPLYYGWMGKSLLFGSELKAVVAHPDFRGEVDPNSLAMYLKYSCVPTPHSVYRGIHKLPAGTRLALKDSDASDSLVPIPYWSANEVARRGMNDPYSGSAKEAVAHLDELLRDAIKMRMVADVPLGAFLSGGVDSSTVVALMQAQSTRPVKTFSIGFYESGYNEAIHAAAVARHLGTDHTELYVSSEEARRTIPLLPALYDEPFSDSSQIPTYLVSRLARKQVTVSLSGDGGDELFGGYKRYFLWGNVWKALGWLPHPVRQAASRRLRRLSPKQWNHLASLLGLFFARFRQIDSPGDKVHRLANMLSAEDSFSRYDAIVSACEPLTPILQGARAPTTPLQGRGPEPELFDFCRYMMFLDVVTYLPDDILVKVDRASMAVSLEVRVPLLDHRVIEFAARLPQSMKVRGGQGKWLLRRVLSRYVPKKLTERPKQGFALPIAEWLRGPLREWAEDLLHEDRLNSEGFFHPGTVRTLWHEHLSRQRDQGDYLWGLLMFQAWLDHWRKPTTRIPQTILERTQSCVRG
jgi:asparagine synthase (glutamine-hydrolysing)